MTHDLSTAPWRRSSHSGDNGDNGGNCVEAAPGFIPGLVPVRDSKDPEGPALLFTADAFTAFLDAVRAGEFPTG